MICARRARSRFTPMMDRLDGRITPSVFPTPAPVPIDMGEPPSLEPVPTTVTWPGDPMELSGPTTSV